MDNLADDKKSAHIFVTYIHLKFFVIYVKLKMFYDEHNQILVVSKKSMKG